MSLSDAPAPAVHEFPPIATSDRPRAADKAECRHDLQDRFLRAGREAFDDRELLQLPLSGSHSPAEAGDLAANLLDTFGRHGVSVRICCSSSSPNWNNGRVSESLKASLVPQFGRRRSVREETPPVLDIRKPVDEGEALRKRCGTAVGGQRRENPVEGVLVERRQEIVAQGCVIFVF